MYFQKDPKAEVRILISFVTDNDMDLGALQNNFNSTLENVYDDNLESSRTNTPSNGNPVCNGEQADLLRGGDAVKRSQPLFIQANRYVEEEQSIVGNSSHHLQGLSVQKLYLLEMGTYNFI
ncbi:hypothetical protein JD844_002159 [Phrynosoma platyrhinos]|uniref:Uncharacterized protein n=1 Tax=Phrynosoma platyrhinos TaxID=52577 RepID=A0ABQ7TB50_PHRPL|nr:hypothetical protein JD844_002159 [Phrynosoma platyrhinos]